MMYILYIQEKDNRNRRGNKEKSSVVRIEKTKKKVSLVVKEKGF